ncbi:MAG: hypothetical protein K6E79_01680 [Pseudobutyrivibrio sp.]|nr:hypothetical protein [Pseudobutyrivibrio sp.]
MNTLTTKDKILANIAGVVGIIIIVLTIGAIFESLQLYRVLPVYAAQLVVGAATAKYGFFDYKKYEQTYFQGLIYTYGALVILRVSTIYGDGDNPLLGIIVKVLLCALICTTVSFAAHLDSRFRTTWLSIIAIVLEIVSGILFSYNYMQGVPSTTFIYSMRFVGTAIVIILFLFNRFRVRLLDIKR